MPTDPAQPPLKGHLRGARMAACSVLLLCLGITVAAWAIARESQRKQDQVRLSRFAGRIQLSLQNRLGRYEDIARGAVGSFLGEARPLSVAQWRDYVDQLDLPGRHPGLSSLAFVRRVKASELEAYLAAHPQLTDRYHPPPADPLPLREPGQDGDHLILELCEPGPRARRGLGLDAGLSLTRRLAAEQAEGTGQPALSGLLYFTPTEVRQHAVAFFVPVYQGQSQARSARPKALEGWVSAAILLQPLMDDILLGEDPGIGLEVVDTSAVQGPRWLYTGTQGPSGAPPDAVRTLTVGGRNWQLRYAIQPAFYQAEGRKQPLTILVSGIALSLSLAAAAWSLVGTRRRARELAEKMNASLHEALQRNRSHLTYTPLAVIETDADFRVTEWNGAAERTFGYTREEALGKDPRTLLIPEDGQEAVDLRRETLLQNENGTRLTMENLTRTGQRIPCDWYNTALRDEEGRFIGAIFLADDLTERRRAESALRQSQKLESLGVLAGGIAHDFNNLLTAILGNAEVALGHLPDDPILRNALQRIETTTQRGSDLARQLLAYAGKAHFAIKPLDLNALIVEMGDLLSVSISKKVALRTDLQPGLPSVEADSAQFQQVVMNLVINASEAIGDHPGTVTLRTRTQSYRREELQATFPGQVLHPGPYVRMEVEDNGCGMDAETIGRIFDPFFTTKFTGRGLGLSAMLGIVRGHQAGIRVESTPGEGTTFILLFPASSAPLHPAPTAPAPTTAVSGTVLVVDDESIIRELARGALEGAGFRVLEARDGLEALEHFQPGRERVDLVLLDMTMPRMGGAEAFQRIQGLSPETRVLLTSGYTLQESMASLGELPPAGFLQKPFRIRELVAKVREILRGSH